MGNPPTKDEKERAILTFATGWLSEQLQREVAPDSAFAALGLDSLDVVRMTDALAEHLHLDELPVAVVLDHPTVASLAAHLATLES